MLSFWPSIMFSNEILDNTSNIINVMMADF